jgi:hypothetical protein
MTTELLLRVKELAIYVEFKGSLAAHDKNVIFDYVLVIADYLIRHTDGARGIVSRHAVFEGNIVFSHKGLRIGF